MKIELYPIGTCVTLKGGSKTVMIFGRMMQRAGDPDGIEYNYLACPYPEGHLSDELNVLFSHEDIAYVHHRGLINIDEQICVAEINKKYASSAHEDANIT